MNIKFKHFGILSIILLLVTSVFLNIQKPKHSVAPQDNHPGWFKQFIAQRR